MIESVLSQMDHSVYNIMIQAYYIFHIIHISLFPPLVAILHHYHYSNNDDVDDDGDNDKSQ